MSHFPVDDILNKIRGSFSLEGGDIGRLSDSDLAMQEDGRLALSEEGIAYILGLLSERDQRSIDLLQQKNQEITAELELIAKGLASLKWVKSKDIRFEIGVLEKSLPPLIGAKRADVEQQIVSLKEELSRSVAQEGERSNLETRRDNLQQTSTNNEKKIQALGESSQKYRTDLASFRYVIREAVSPVAPQVPRKKESTANKAAIALGVAGGLLATSWLILKKEEPTGSHNDPQTAKAPFVAIGQPQAMMPPKLVDIEAQRARLLTEFQSYFENSLKNYALRNQPVPSSISSSQKGKLLSSIQNIQLMGVDLITHAQYTYSYTLLIPEGQYKGSYRQKGTFDISYY